METNDERQALMARLRDEDTTQHWSVSVDRNGENLVVIESNMLAGKPEFSDEDARVIRECAAHLLAFIGPAAPPADLVALRTSLLSGLEAIRLFSSPHAVHTSRCNGDEDTPCDCGSINPRDVTEALYEQVLALDAAAPRVPDTPQGWQPIETAPKDGRYVLGWCRQWKQVIQVRWLTGSERWTTTYAPTHWQPLPAPPQEDQ